MAGLYTSWLKRKRFEARLLAEEVGRMLFGGGDSTSTAEDNLKPPPGATRVPTDALLGEMGFYG